MDKKVYINNCDIILLSWNNLELLKKCIYSILRYTDVPCHLLIVDNASQRETQEYLKSLKDTDLIHITLYFNSINEGFSKGMNLGLKQSRAPYACLLNNDTEVSPQWLSRILKTMDQNPNIGILNPNSNVFGLKSRKNLEEISTLIALNSPFREMGLCIGFCMFIRQEVIQKIGYLDAESYDQFFFEDSDYCKRAKKAGYVCAMAPNSYVYHREHQSTNKLATKEHLFKKNQAVFYKKWGKPKRILFPLIKNETHWSELEKKLLPVARRDHFIQVITSDKKAPLQASHTQIRFKSIVSLLPFSWLVLGYFIIKRKKPFDIIFVPQPSLSIFLKKCPLPYNVHLITTWEELNNVT